MFDRHANDRFASEMRRADGLDAPSVWEIQPDFDWIDAVFADLDAEMARLNPLRAIGTAIRQVAPRGA